MSIQLAIIPAPEQMQVQRIRVRNLDRAHYAFLASTIVSIAGSLILESQSSNESIESRIAQCWLLASITLFTAILMNQAGQNSPKWMRGLVVLVCLVASVASSYFSDTDKTGILRTLSYGFSFAPVPLFLLVERCHRPPNVL